MMSLDERFHWLLLGIVIGAFLGYATRVFIEARQEHADVKTKFPKDDAGRTRDERGLARYPVLHNTALAIVVALTVIASVKSQLASNDVKDTQNELVRTQDKLEATTACNREILAEVLDAINVRTTYTQGQASANKELQAAQQKFLDVLFHRPPYTDAVRSKAGRNYQAALKNFLAKATAAEKNAKITKYPDASELSRCVAERTKDSRTKG